MGGSAGTINQLKERRTRLLLAALCVPLILVGLAVRGGTDAETAVRPITLGDISDANLVEIRDQRGVTVLSGEFRSRVDTLGNTEKDAALTDRRGRRVIGEVELEIPAAGRDDRRPELEVDIIGLAPRETFTVAIDDRVVGSFVTDDRGSVDMELQEGEDPAAPFRNGA
jgi:hypothetical protein